MIVVVDFDGTLALGDTSNIDGMIPNISIISMVNEMYKDGNIINIVTARGSKSCSSSEEKEQKYSHSLKSWLSKHKVNYHNISFNKEYADIYLDDRAFNIKETFFYQKLDSHFTTNKVRRFNNIVVKKTDSSISEFEWYIHAENMGVQTPKVLSYDIDTISTNFIDGKICKNFDLISETLTFFKKHEPKNMVNFGSYIDRIETHLTKNKFIIGGDSLLDKLKKINLPNTFNHGDFSVFNMIESNNNLFLIDPIFQKNLFQSYYIDIAKHLFSILYYLFDYEFYEHFYLKYMEKFSLSPEILDVLIASESIRVANRNNKFCSISNNLIDSLKN